MLDLAVADGFDCFIVDNVGLPQFNRYSIIRLALDRPMKAIGRGDYLRSLAALLRSGRSNSIFISAWQPMLTRFLKGAPVAEIPVEGAPRRPVARAQRLRPASPGRARSYFARDPADLVQGSRGPQAMMHRQPQASR